MGVASDLDYRIARQNILQRTMNRIAGTWPMPRVMAPILPRLDTMISAATGGKASLTRAGGHEVLWVGMRGRRTGQIRQVPLLAFPFDDDLAVIGSNFGRPEIPAWAHNLWATPDVELTVGERTVDARSREATSEEAEVVWRTATEILPAYAGYRRRVTERSIPVFIFEPRPGPDAA